MIRTNTDIRRAEYEGIRGFGTTAHPLSCTYLTGSPWLPDIVMLHFVLIQSLICDTSVHAWKRRKAEGCVIWL